MQLKHIDTKKDFHEFNLVMSFFYNINQKSGGKGIPSMKFWKLSHDKTKYDFERVLVYSLKTVFTDILKPRKLKSDIICAYKCISSHMKPLYFTTI